jgi:hypothetical protein
VTTPAPGFKKGTIRGTPLAVRDSNAIIGLPLSVPVHDIAIQQRDNEIILGTHGRSLYAAKLDDVQKLKNDPDWLKKKPKAMQNSRNRTDDGSMEPE